MPKTIRFRGLTPNPVNLSYVVCGLWSVVSGYVKDELYAWSGTPKIKSKRKLVFVTPPCIFRSLGRKRNNGAFKKFFFLYASIKKHWLRILCTLLNNNNTFVDCMSFFLNDLWSFIEGQHPLLTPYKMEYSFLFSIPKQTILKGWSFN